MGLLSLSLKVLSAIVSCYQCQMLAKKKENMLVWNFQNRIEGRIVFFNQNISFRREN